MALTDAQLDEFHDRGHTRRRGCADRCRSGPRDRHHVRISLTGKRRTCRRRAKITELYEDESFLTRYARLFAQSAEIGRGMDIYDLRAKPVFDFLRNDNLLDAVESFVGPEITCSPIQHLRGKPPSRLDASPSYNVPWHQDSGRELGGVGQNPGPDLLATPGGRHGGKGMPGGDPGRDQDGPSLPRVGRRH